MLRANDLANCPPDLAPRRAALLAFRQVHVLLDYRPALRDRSGVGEYVHELAAALADTAPQGHRVDLFTSSWKDRPDPQLAIDSAGIVHDRRVPVRVLNWRWHRTGIPRVERLVPGPFDVVHAAHPLLIPSRAAGIVTIHDLDFLDHPERTRAEVRRDYGDRVRAHARRADGVLTSSRHSLRRIVDALAIPQGHVVVAPPGPPRWTGGGRRTPRNPSGLRAVRRHTRTTEEPREPCSTPTPP